MKAYEIQNNTGITALTLVDRSERQPTANQVLIKVHAVSLNYRDILVSEGSYGVGHKYPLIPASDSAGAVLAVVSGVKRVKVGDRLAQIFCQNWIDGALTSAVC